MFDLKKVAHIINQLAMLQFCFLKVYYIVLQVFFLILRLLQFITILQKFHDIKIQVLS